jgi:elongation factor P--(R)-beta-lysine ligase
LQQEPQRPSWDKDVYADRRPFLVARNRLLAALRRWFEANGFLEVETPILQVSPGNETHLHAFSTELIRPDLSRERLYLHTSPEFACKKLLAAGEKRIATFARVFRNRERTPTHSPEFTMLEWYRADEGYDAIMADCHALLKVAAQSTGQAICRFGGLSCDLRAEPERLSLVEAFRRHAGINLDPDPSGKALASRERLAEGASRLGLRVSADDRWSDLFSKIVSAAIEPHLGAGRPTILCEYPISEAALARPKPDDPRFAERFELYVCGVELANAFGELTDPAEQRARFIADMDEKERLYGEIYPIDEDFIAALGQMPEAGGAALGFDRLAMLASGARRIEDVLWLPVTG